MFISLISLSIYYNVESILEMMQGSNKISLISLAAVFVILSAIFLWAKKRDDKVICYIYINVIFTHTSSKMT